MRQGTKILLSYSGDIPETVAFDLTDDVVQDNNRNLEGFVKTLDATTSADPAGGSTMWRSVPPEVILEGFLAAYQTDRKVFRVRPAFLAEYIRRCVQVGELGSWTVRLVSSSKGRQVSIGAHTVGLITRAPTNDIPRTSIATPSDGFSAPRTRAVTWTRSSTEPRSRERGAQLKARPTGRASSDRCRRYLPARHSAPSDGATKRYSFCTR